MPTIRTTNGDEIEFEIDGDDAATITGIELTRQLNEVPEYTNRTYSGTASFERVRDGSDDDSSMGITNDSRPISLESNNSVTVGPVDADETETTTMKPCDECIKERAEKIHESHVPNIVSALTAVEVMEECHIIMPGEQAERDEMLTATRQELQSELSELERRDD